MFRILIYFLNKIIPGCGSVPLFVCVNSECVPVFVCVCSYLRSKSYKHGEVLLSHEWDMEVEIRGSLQWTQTCLPPLLTSASKPNTPACVGFINPRQPERCVHTTGPEATAGPSIKLRLLLLSGVHLWMKCWGLVKN